MCIKVHSEIDLEKSMALLQIANDSALTEETADQLFELYSLFQQMPKESIDTNAYQWMAHDFSSVKTCAFAWKDLDVDIPLKKIEEILQKTGVLQLRPISKDAKILVVGCGNGPIADAGGYPLASKEDKHEGSEQYRKEHIHTNAVTINPHLAANPTLVGFFGAQKFPMLKTGQFDLIVIEGTSIADTSLGRGELERLLSPNGIVVSNEGSKEGLEFSWEDNSADRWADDYQRSPTVIKDLNAFESFNYQEE